MNFTTGPHGLWNLSQVLYPQYSDRKIHEIISLWGMTLVHPKELPPEWKRAIKAVPIKRPPGMKVPWILIKDAGKFARTPTKREQEIILYCITGLIKVLRDGEHFPGRLNDPEGILTLTLSGPPDDPELEADVRTYTMTSPAASTPVILPPAGVRRAPRIAGRWIVGIPTVPARIAGDDRELRILLVVDADSGLVLHHDSLFSDQLAKAADSLFQLFQGKSRSLGQSPIKGLPQEILFADELLSEALGQSMEVLSVPCSFNDTDPAWTEACESIKTFMSTMEPGS